MRRSRWPSGTPSWPRRISALLPNLSVCLDLRTKKDYARATEMLDAILDEIGEDEKHPFAELADALGVFVEKYEAEHVRIPEAKPAAGPKFLVQLHDLRQSALPQLV